jgi:hypothetical protein
MPEEEPKQTEIKAEEETADEDAEEQNESTTREV